MRHRRLPNPPQTERRHGNAQLTRCQISLKVGHYPDSEPGRRAAFTSQIFYPEALGLYKCKFRCNKKCVCRKQTYDDDNTGGGTH